MKKYSYLIVLALILGLILTGCTLLSNISQVPATEQSGIAYLTKGGPTENEAESFPLYAGQDWLVGEVLVWNDGLELCVKYQLSPEAITDGWGIYETHVDAATSLEGIPQKNGNPPPGKLRYGEDDDLTGVAVAGPYCIPLEDIIGYVEGELCGTDIVIAAHAVVKKYEEFETCIDFENYNEKKSVMLESTPNGPVNFYMTDKTLLEGLTMGSTTTLLPVEGKYPQVAVPETVESTSDYADIVAFTISNNSTYPGYPYTGYIGRDDIILDDNGTGASGNTLTDPQDLIQEDALQQHVYAQGLAIVIDVSSVENVQGLNFAAIDLDHDETWYFLYFDENNILIDIYTLIGNDPTGDGKAFPITYPNPISKVAIFGGMNLGVSDRIGYAIDHICVTYLMEESETAWGDTYWEGVTETNFPGKNWATYINYSMQVLLETVQVTPFGTAAYTPTPTYSNIALEAGKNYSLRASGTYRFANWGEYGIADAAWNYRRAANAPGGVAGWYQQASQRLQVWIGGEAVTWQPTEYNPEHIYTLDVTGEGGQLMFTIEDDQYSDNTGSIMVEIWGECSTP